ncbi:MAG TPA: cation transporter [Ruminococcus sp.]|nr:cation transporter [Ruminococcus sp.]
MDKEYNRTSEIIKVSFRGIAVNLLLVIFKAGVGLAAHSIAVILDAVNNLSDALSSVITIIGAKLAGKAADRQHPYGHGRIEYITDFAIAILILIAGLTSLKESILKIITPDETNHTFVSLIVIAAAIAAKIILGLYYRKKGKELNSGSLSASGTDALFDSVISVATFISAVVSMTLHVNLEGILGAVISMFILKAGAEIMMNTMNHIIGERFPAELTAKIRDRLCEHPEVLGAYDLILHSYGPEESFGSVHIELDDNITVRKLDTITRTLTAQIYQEFGVILTIGVYASNTDSETAKEMKHAIRNTIEKYPQILQMHGFYTEEAVRAVSFDLIFDFKTESPESITDEIRRALNIRYPDYQFFINIDRDFSD